ncbi:MAG TPA: MJ0042-type zinc finger domain-containing protein [Xanthobacteraceae bacterium]|jgi:predicted Zn finger-like uncharacterized protein|nr:MJ0042-type zinc finger domain-containing protein [Xanthobacteraceae bacterium]
MLIVCPNCATSYDVEMASLRPNGRKVRCARCKEVWQAELSHADKLMAAAEALAPVRRTVEAMAEAATEDTDEDAAAADHPPHPHVQTQAEAWFDGPEDDPSFGKDPFATDSPPIAPTDLDADHPPAAVDKEAIEAAAPALPHIEDIETLAARRYPQRSKLNWLRWPLSGMQSIILALILLNAIVIGWRNDFVRLMPQTASFYARLGLPVNLRGLDFQNLSTSTEQHEGVPILVVEGEIINETRKIIDVPRLRFAVRNAARQEIYSWTAILPRTLLSPGDAVPFRTRLASPPPDAHDVLVRFLNRNDIYAGSR